MSDERTRLRALKRAVFGEPRLKGFTVRRFIGGGGQAKVYEVVRDRDGRRFALRWFAPLNDSWLGELRRKRLESEIRILKVLSCEGTPSCAEMCSCSERSAQQNAVRSIKSRVPEPGARLENPYILLDFVEGRNLREALRLPDQPSGEPGDPLPEELAARLVEDLCGVVRRLHKEGFIHRDIKPSNIMLRSDGSPVLIDFGIATRLAGGRGTRTGQEPGTVGRLSPYVDRPEDAYLHDIYALGLILGECLSARHIDRFPALGEKELGGRELRRITRKALGFDGESYAAVDELEADLLAFRLRRERGLPLRRRMALWAAAAMAVLLCLTALRALTRPEPPPPPIAAGSFQKGSALRGLSLRPVSGGSEPGFRLAVYRSQSEEFQPGDVLIGAPEPWTSRDRFFADVLAAREGSLVELAVSRRGRLRSLRLRALPVLGFRGAHGLYPEGSSPAGPWRVARPGRLAGKENAVLAINDEVFEVDGRSTARADVREALDRKRFNEASILLTRTGGQATYKVMVHGVRGRIELARAIKSPSGFRLEAPGAKPLTTNNYASTLIDRLHKERWRIVAPLRGGGLLLQRRSPGEDIASLASVYQMTHNANFKDDLSWRFRDDPALGRALSGRPHAAVHARLLERGYLLCHRRLIANAHRLGERPGYVWAYQKLPSDGLALDLRVVEAADLEELADRAAPFLAEDELRRTPRSIAWALRGH